MVQARTPKHPLEQSVSRQEILVKRRFRVPYQATNLQWSRAEQLCANSKSLERRYVPSVSYLTIHKTKSKVMVIFQNLRLVLILLRKRILAKNEEGISKSPIRRITYPFRLLTCKNIKSTLIPY